MSIKINYSKQILIFIIGTFLNGCLLMDDSKTGDMHQDHLTPITINSDSTSNPTTKAELLKKGETIFTTVCASCHQTSGLGVVGAIPPLKNSDYLMADKTRSINILLNGLEGEIKVNGELYNGKMPKIVAANADIAAVLTYVRNQLNGATDSISGTDVANARLLK